MRNSIIILLIFCSHWSFGQDYNYDLISTDDGIPSKLIYRVLVDAKGYLWFATGRGVVKYDGHNMKIFSTAEGLTTNLIWSIWEDSQGRIWLSNFSKEVQFIENDSVKSAFTKSTARSPDNFYEEDGAVYTVDSKYLYCYNNGTSTKTKLPISANEKHPILFSKGIIQTHSTVNATRRITFFDGEKLLDSIIYSKDSTPAMSGSQGKYVTDTNYIFAFSNNHRLVRWNWRTNTSKYFDLSTVFGKKSRAIVFLSGDNIQISSDHGMILLDKELHEVERFILPKPWPKESTHFVIQSRGIILDMAEKGTYVLTPQRKEFSHFNIEGTGNYVTILEQGINRNIIIGCDDGSIFEITDSLLIRRLDKSANPYHPVTSIHVFDTFYRVSIGKTISYYSKEFERLRINPFRQNQGSEITFPTRLGGVYHHPKLNWTVYTTNRMAYLSKTNGDTFLEMKKIDIFRPMATAITDDSIIWFGGSGLKYFKEDSLYDISKEHELYNKPIEALLMDEQHNLWVGTDGFGMYCYRKGHAPTVVQGCEFDEVSDIKASPSGDIWVATIKGLKKIEVTYHPTFSAKVVRTYLKSDGLSNDAPFRICFKDSLLYIGSRSGVDILPYDFSKTKVAIPKLYISDCQVNGQTRNIEDLKSLKYEENSIAFTYSGVSLASKKPLSYHYYIGNLTNDTLVTEENTIHLSSISPGSYQMVLFVQDYAGNRSKIKEIQFSIAKPWYLQWWAMIIYFGLFSTITYLLSAVRINKIRKQETTKKRMSELELQALQSQLNPHFIFNALGAIQYYQTDQDMELAEEYLGDFARLMRLYLESSKRAIVPLKDELELIQLYIDLEKLRFEDKFSVDIHIDQQLEFEQINIPSMVLQPFVENAINHGLFHKKEAGHLSILVKKLDDQWVHIVVKDNGIGREKAKKITQTSPKNYKSRAMQIIEERLTIMNKTGKDEIKIEIIDLFNDQGEAAGTEVQIHLPILE